MTKKQIQVSAEKLANTCLENAEVHHGYSDCDLLNAVLIFSHFLLDVFYTENQHISKKKEEDLAETIGRSIRELVRVSTGKDTHVLLKDDKKKYEIKK